DALYGVIGILGMLAGMVLGWFIGRGMPSGRIAGLLAESRAQSMTWMETGRRQTEEIASLQELLSQSRQEILDTRIQSAELKTTLEGERAASAEKLALLQDFRGSLMDAYRSISSGILRENHQDFMQSAGLVLSRYLEAAKQDHENRARMVADIMAPVTDALACYDARIQDMERNRGNAHAGLTEQISSLLNTQNQLQKETGRLVRALRVPHVRGRWGEMTLKRVVEMAGMVEQCDFCQQFTVQAETGMQRPDMIIHLPGDRRIVVDAKVPITAYLESLEAETEADQGAAMDRHARQVMVHVQKLAAKSYWDQVQPSPEFVVLFIPGENFFSAAVSRDTGLIEAAASKGVIIATPISLISLLKTVGFAWRQEKSAENIKEIRDLGAAVYERLCTMAGHLNRLGKDIEKCVDTYNQTAGSFEKRVLAPSRKLAELGVSGKRSQSMPEPVAVESRPRYLNEESVQT
ncbi:MAG: DNA recombination protein RmuC, partial [Desulfatirhabdiaceae bacterium]